MIVVNLFGAPSSGKSTGAAYIFSKLKLNGVNAEYVSEFAKDKVWEESKEVFKNQAYIFGKQYFRQSRLNNKVDVIITDSPLLLSSFYNKNDSPLGEDFQKVVRNVFDSYINNNYFLLRDKPYNPKGRFQTEKESDVLSNELLEYLNNNNIRYEILKGNQDNYDKIVEQVLNYLNSMDKSDEDGE